MYANVKPNSVPKPSAGDHRQGPKTPTYVPPPMPKVKPTK